MKDELTNLRQRVADLETTLAAMAVKQQPQHRRFFPTVVFSAAVVCALVIGLCFSSSGTATAVMQGPSRVVAPFEVVDGKGRTLFKIQMSASGAGLGIFYDDAGQEVAIIGHANGSQQPTIRVMDKGIDKVGIGISKGDGLIQVGNDVDSKVQLVSGENADVHISTAEGQLVTRMFKTKSGDGAMDINKGGKPRVELGIAEKGDCGIITLYSNTTQARTILLGDYGMRQTSAQGQPAFQAGVDDRGVGYAMAAGRSGKFLSRLTTDDNGMTGRVEVMGSDEIKVLMGVKENDKGDICATGAPGKQVCLSILAAKSLIPY